MPDDSPSLAAAGFPAARTGPAALGAMHRRRLRDVYRSAGWPHQDSIEVELVAAGLLERERGDGGRETVRVSDAGIAVLAETLAKNRARRDPHEALVERIALEMTRAGRLAWRGLALRARVGERWAMAMPDVFSIRHTTVEAYLEPIVHEVKVRRADLVSDLRRPAKREAYLQLGGECWYAVAAGIAEPDEIPAECGVLVCEAGRLVVARAAQRRPARLAFATWMALARATPVPGWTVEDAQPSLGPAASDAAGASAADPVGAGVACGDAPEDRATAAPVDAAGRAPA